VFVNYRRVIIPEPGNSGVLQVVEGSIPKPKAGEVRVKVLAAGVARADILMRRGLYPEAVPAYPFTPGYDIAGEVDALGGGASRFQIGDMVVALTETGGYAEYICLPEGRLVSVPSELDPAQVVCLPLNYITAYQTLHRFARVQPGEQILIHAAASGVGTAQLQLGNLVNLRMYATASEAKHNIVSSLGAEPIDYQVEDFVERIRAITGEGVDAVFDPVGGAHIYRSFKALNDRGRLIAYGEMGLTGEHTPSFNEVALHHDLPLMLNDLPGDKTVRWYECFVENQAHPDWYHQDLEILVNLLARGKITPIIAGRFTLNEAAQAHDLIEAAAVSGKIVLVFGS
jgi:NADPH2:quinone reductase